MTFLEPAYIRGGSWWYRSKILDAAQRKLTTILAADVVGYSQLMATDEEAALNTLRGYLKVTGALVAKHNGRIFSTAGDAFLAEFSSAVEAVRCAISIQEDLAVRNSQLPEQDQMWFRIGVNVGDVMIEKDDLFGDGVNIAARLEGFAEKGGICISGSTFDQVKNKLSIAFDDIGTQKVKNIPEPIPAFRLKPGKVAVEPESKSTLFRNLSGAVGLNPRTLLLAGASVLALFLGGAYFGGLLPTGPASAYPFDGHWTVTLNSLSGCLNNSSRSYSMSVRRGKIEEPQHRFPKKGDISRDGELSIRITDRTGNLRATLTGTLTGETGMGRLQGRKPGCSGDVTLVRLD